MRSLRVWKVRGVEHIGCSGQSAAQAYWLWLGGYSPGCLDLFMSGAWHHSGYCKVCLARCADPDRLLWPIEKPIPR